MVGNTSDAAIFGTDGEAESGTYATLPELAGEMAWHRHAAAGGGGSALACRSRPRDRGRRPAAAARAGACIAESEGPLSRPAEAGRSRALATRSQNGLCLIEPVPGREVKEVYPLKLLEMMSSGLPIIATVAARPGRDRLGRQCRTPRAAGRRRRADRRRRDPACEPGPQADGGGRGRGDARAAGSAGQRRPHGAHHRRGRVGGHRPMSRTVAVVTYSRPISISRVRRIVAALAESGREVHLLSPDVDPHMAACRGTAASRRTRPTTRTC